MSPEEPLAEWIKTQLTTTFQPEFIEIHDQSYQHRHHEGAKQGGGHFTVEIKADTFLDKPLLQCHRLIYDALGNVVGNEIHALSIKIIR